MNTFQLSDEEVCYVISALHAQTKRQDITTFDREFSAALRDKFATKIAPRLDSATLALIDGS